MATQKGASTDSTQRESPPPAAKLLTGDDVAKLLQVSRSFAYTLIRRGEIPCLRLGRAVRVRQEDLQRFIEYGVSHCGS